MFDTFKQAQDLLIDNGYQRAPAAKHYVKKVDRKVRYAEIVKVYGGYEVEVTVK